MVEYPEIIYGKTSRETENAHLDAVQSELNDIKNKKSEINQKVRDLQKSFIGESRETKLDIIYSIDTTKRSMVNLDGVAKELKNSPYFARLDFETEDDSYILYISKGPIRYGVADRGEVKYINWRAPIADLYYRYNHMPFKNAVCKVPDGMRLGDISLVARIEINGGRLNNVFISSLEDAKNESYKSGVSDFLQNKLASNSSDKMTEIVETIQSEQNDIVRYDPNKNVIIQGAAGSGKTAVGLHRVAYLLYKDLEDSEILFISPNKDFSDYISDVLPELGELNIAIKTFDEIYEKVFGKVPNSIYEIIEKYFDRDSFDPYTSLLYDRRIDQVVKNLIAIAKDKHETILEWRSALEKIREDEDIKIKQGPKVSRTSSDALWNKYCVERIDGKRFEPTIDIANNIDFLYYAIVETIIAELEYTNTSEDLNYTKSGTVNKQKNLVEVKHEIKHIVIDEAQDYTKWHIFLLHLLCPKAKFTILGDKNQNVNPYLKDNPLDKLLSEVDEEYRYFEINKAYRSSPEIVKYTNRIVGANVEPVRKSQGIEVNEYTVNKFNSIEPDDFLEDIREFRKHGLKRIGIITRDEAIAGLLSFDELLDDDNIHVMPVYEAKGLEFDAVIVIDSFRDNEKELFYTACTRAQHALVVYTEE